MQELLFNTVDGTGVKLMQAKKAVILALAEDSDEIRFELTFSQEEFKRLFDDLESLAYEIWEGLAPREATSAGSDYWEYYDRRLDNNGYLSASTRKCTLYIERPARTNKKLYQFNKRKMESFLYDYKAK
ncbi:hypothetical protein [Listeria booriae]|uniref:hypothetical protein n=1 Tax=Listeria booriae TaxID=1552123 RepID=UPI0016251B84|nr:hypothetical protein [Listeria booriae]MBC2149524.1 hypothetical protein [Listeria booriae]